MHLILTGATGLVGSAVLHHILSLPPTSSTAQKLTRVSILSRRPDVPLLTHPDRPMTNTLTKIEVIPHSDFKTYPASVLSQLQGADNDEQVGVIWALGCSSREVTHEPLYDEITRAYAVTAAQTISTALDAPRVNFVYVSGEGATTRPGIFTPMFGRVKGQTEKELLELMGREPYSKNLRVYSARPGGVDGASQKAVAEDAANREYRRTLSWRLMENTFLPLLRTGVWKGMHSPTDELARVLTELALGDGERLSGTGIEGEGRTISNVGLRRLGGALK